MRDFADYTLQNSDKTFYVTKIGCGIAGFAIEEIAEVFKHVAFSPNVILPEEFGEEKNIAGYKGFDHDMTCRGFQFKEDETFEEDVEPVVCTRGFHFCESPFSVLAYRDLLDEHCKFIPIHQVTGLGKSVTDGDKIATTKIHIGARLDLPGFIKAGINFLYDKCIKEAPKSNISSGDGAKIGSSGYGAKIGSSGDGAKIGSSGDGAQIGSSGDGAQIGSSGDGAQIGSSGYGAKIGSSGDGAKIGSSGDGAQIGSSGYGAQIGSSGDGAKIGSSGDGAKIGSSGYGAKIGSSGDGAKIGSSGYGAKIGSSGDGAKIGSSGDGAKIGSSGYGAKIGSSGDGAKIGSSGYGAKIESAGTNAVVSAIGNNSIIKAKKGSWITLAEYGNDGNPLCVKSAQIDGKTLKADVFYCLKGGKFVEVKGIAD
ncbi:MAG: hypothetical protein NC548_18725 [Lachnospiraceae bacterium]|nr:hypothetical protein [Lachnospiraceae bacterium]